MAHRADDANAHGVGARVVSALVLAPVALGLVYAGGAAFNLLVLVAATLMAYEWERLCRRGAAPAGAARAGGLWLAGGAVYIAVPCIAIIWLRADETVGRETVFWLFAVVWATDVGAYFAGRGIGGPKLAPRNSPKKTWAGLAGGMIPTYPGEARPYNLADFEALWAAAQDLDVPLNFHIAATCAGPGQVSVFTSEWTAPDAAAYSATQDYWVRRSLGSMIFAGVFERFPGLKVAVVEHELAWALYFLQKMDVTYKELSQTAPYRFKDEVLPSDFFRSQIFLTFQEDRIGLETLPPMIGTDTLMFGSDYPHAESTWPRSREFLDDLLAGVDRDVRRKLVCDNVAKLYKFN